MKNKEIVIKKRELILSLAIVLAFFMGYYTGQIAQLYETTELISSIDIDNLNIDLNETQMIDAIWDKVEHTTNITRPDTK